MFKWPRTCTETGAYTVLLLQQLHLLQKHCLEIRHPHSQETSTTPVAGVVQGNLSSIRNEGLPTRRGCPVELHLFSDITTPS